jgi:solute carrier family 25 protein 33/36
MEGLLGVSDALLRSINFFAYGNGKKIYARALNDGKESAAIHLISAATAGVLTATATNPIWVVKTRLQLQNAQKPSPQATSSASSVSRGPKATASFSSIASHHRPSTQLLFTPSFSRPAATIASPERFSNSLQCIGHIWRNEGIKGFYRGLSASLLGVTEGTIQWTLYEQFKTIRKKQGLQREEGWVDKVGAAGAAKLIATMITYPHEVIRTRLRQSPPTGWSRPKYHGLYQSFSLILKEEGAVALYGGLSPHLLRVVPNAAVMYSIYELVVKYGKSEAY